MAQSVARLTQETEAPGSKPGPATLVSPSADSKRAVVIYWRKYVHRLGGLSLARKSVVRLTDRPDMTLVVYRRRKTTQQQNVIRKVSKDNVYNLPL